MTRLTVVSEVELDEVKNDVHEVFNTDRPDTVHVGSVRLRECRRSDLTSRTGQELSTATVWCSVLE